MLGIIRQLSGAVLVLTAFLALDALALVRDGGATTE